MNIGEKLAGLAVILMLTFAGFVLWQYYDAASKCRERGGVPLRGAFWIECVKAEIVR